MEARIEYERILNDAIDWLRYGYRRERVVENNEVSELDPRPGTAPRSSEKNDFAASENGANSFDTKKDYLNSQIAAYQSTSEEKTDSISQHGGEIKRIAEEIASCEKCNLYLIRENTVPGVGVENPLLMIVTAAPVFGAKETDGPLSSDEFNYLDKWLRALNLEADSDTFIVPAVKCRTPGGRPPDAKELDECSQYFRRQFAELKPRAILALGAAACGVLTGDISNFPSLVGKLKIWEGVPSLVLWSPAEVRRNPVRLRKPVWEALQKLRDKWNALS